MEGLILELMSRLCWYDAQYYIMYVKVKKMGLPDDTNIAFDLYNPQKELIDTKAMCVGTLKKIVRHIEERHPNIREYVEKELYKNKEE